MIGGSHPLPSWRPHAFWVGVLTLSGVAAFPQSALAQPSRIEMPAGSMDISPAETSEGLGVAVKSGTVIPSDKKIRLHSDGTRLNEQALNPCGNDRPAQVVVVPPVPSNARVRLSIDPPDTSPYVPLDPLADAPPYGYGPYRPPRTGAERAVDQSVNAILFEQLLEDLDDGSWEDGNRDHVIVIPGYPIAPRTGAEVAVDGANRMRLFDALDPWDW